MSGERVSRLPGQMLVLYAYCPNLAHAAWVDGVPLKAEKQLAVAAPTSDFGDSARTESLSSAKLGLYDQVTFAVADRDEALPVVISAAASGLPMAQETLDKLDLTRLAVDALLLREQGYRCPYGLVVNSRDGARRRRPLTSDLLEQTAALLAQAHEALAAADPPTPVEDPGRCGGCPIVDICLPDQFDTDLVAADDADEGQPMSPDRQPLYVVTHGTKLHARGESILVEMPNGEKNHFKLCDTSQVCMLARGSVTLPFLGALAKNDIPFVCCAASGWVYGVFDSFSPRGLKLRMRQYEVAADEAASLALARSFISGKIENCRTILRRNCPGVPQSALDQLADARRKAEQARTRDELLGHEGSAARLYFAHFSSLFKSRFGERFTFEHRNRRPPRDPVNALLSYVYGILVKDITMAWRARGFDVALGFLHQPDERRAALALDLAEEFRPLIADSVVLNLVNNGIINPQDFLEGPRGVWIAPEAKRKVVQAYQKRVNVTVAHPLTKRRVPYREVISAQCHELARFLLGRLPAYQPFTTR